MGEHAQTKGESDSARTHAATTYCLRCGYSLTGLAGVACPECSRPWHPDDASVCANRASWDAGRGVVRLALACAVGCLASIRLAWLAGSLTAFAIPLSAAWLGMAVAIVALAAPLAGGGLVCATSPALERRATWALWQRSAWLIVIPWASVAVVGALVASLAAAYKAIGGHLGGFGRFGFGTAALMFTGFVCWAIVCWVALALWIQGMVRGLRDGSLAMGRNVPRALALTLASVLLWGGSAAAGVVFGGMLGSVLEATL